MKPGDLVLVRRFDEHILCIYIGPDGPGGICREKWRFLARGEMVYFNLENKIVYGHEVISEIR